MAGPPSFIFTFYFCNFTQTSSPAEPSSFIFSLQIKYAHFLPIIFKIRSVHTYTLFPSLFQTFSPSLPSLLPHLNPSLPASLLPTVVDFFLPMMVTKVSPPLPQAQLTVCTLCCLPRPRRAPAPTGGRHSSPCSKPALLYGFLVLPAPAVLGSPDRRLPLPLSMCFLSLAPDFGSPDPEFRCSQLCLPAPVLGSPDLRLPRSGCFLGLACIFGLLGLACCCG